MLDTFVSDVKRWAMQPYNEEGTILDWALFIGLTIVLTILWTRVIRIILD